MRVFCGTAWPAAPGTDAPLPGLRDGEQERRTPRNCACSGVGAGASGDFVQKSKPPESGVVVRLFTVKGGNCLMQVPF